MGGIKTHAKFLWPFTKVASELNMQEANASAYKLPHSGVYIALLAAVEDFSASTLLRYTQSNIENPSAEDIDTWTEGVKADGNLLKDDYVAEILPNIALRRTLSRVHAQMLESARKLKVTWEYARDTYSLSLIIDIDRIPTLGLIDSFDKHDVLRTLKRHPVALMSLKNLWISGSRRHQRL